MALDLAAVSVALASFAVSVALASFAGIQKSTRVGCGWELEKKFNAVSAVMGSGCPSQEVDFFNALEVVFIQDTQISIL